MNYRPEKGKQLKLLYRNTEILVVYIGKFLAFMKVLIEELDYFLTGDVLSQSGIQRGQLFADFAVDYPGFTSINRDHPDNDREDSETYQSQSQFNTSISTTMVTIRMKSWIMVITPEASISSIARTSFVILVTSLPTGF